MKAMSNITTKNKIFELNESEEQYAHITTDWDDETNNEAMWCFIWSFICVLYRECQSTLVS